MQNNLIENRHIRVFISSTFQDLQDERDYLMRHIFPELRLYASKRDVTLTELDLRWGITEDEAKSGKVLEICFNEIENSVPFFIGIIGNRYGWRPNISDINIDVFDKFEAIKGYIEKHLSVTEMEMQFGVLERADKMHAYFFINDTNDKECVDYPHQLAILKESIRNNKQGYPVWTYSTKEILGQQVKNAFINLLDELYPQGNITLHEAEKIGQRAFKNQLCQSYVTVESNFEVLNKWMKNATQPIMVLTGESGIGKSSLIANWIHSHKNNKHYNFIYYFVGNGGNDGNHNNILEFLINEIRKKYLYDNNDDNIDNYKATLEKLYYQIEAENTPLIIVIDAINQITDEDNAKLLNWLPIPHHNTKILLSTLESDKSMSVFKNRCYPIFELTALNHSQRKQLIETYLGKFAKKLSQVQISRIVNDSQCENTLVLRTFLDELINWGIYEQLDQRIEYYLGEKTIDDFYDKLLKSYESEFGKVFIRDILLGVLLSKDGLNENEIINIFDIKPLLWSQFFCAFRRNFVICNGLINFSHIYIHNAVKRNYKGIEKEYRTRLYNWFHVDKSSRAISEVPYQLYHLQQDDLLYKSLMSLEIFAHMFVYDFSWFKTYWNYLISKSSEKYRLSEYINLTTNDYDEKFIGDTYNQLGYTIDGYFPDYQLALKYYEQALKFRIKNNNEITLDVATTFNNMATTYMNLCDYTKAVEYYNKALAIRKRILGIQHPDVATSYNNLGVAYSETNLSKALDCHNVALKMRIDLLGPEDLDVGISYANICSVLLKLGKYEEGKQNILKALEIQNKRVGEYHENTSIYYGTLALSYSYLNEYELSEKYYLKALSIFSNIYLNNHPYIASCLNGLGGLYSNQYRYEEALKCYKRAIEIYRQIYTKDNYKIGNLYNLIGVLYIEISDYKNAKEYLLIAYQIFESIFQLSKVWSNDYLSVCNNLGYVLYSTGEYENAIRLYEKAIIINNETSPEDIGSLALLKNNIARAYYMLKQYSDSYAIQIEALKLQLQYYGEFNHNTARSYNNLGLIYLSKNDFASAFEYLQKGLNIRQSLKGEYRIDIADSHNNIGDLWYKQKQYKKALESYNMSYELYLSVFDKRNKKCSEVSKKIMKAKVKLLLN